MMNLKKSLLSLPIAAIMINAAIADPAAGGRELPLHGSVPGPEVSQAAFPLLFVEGAGAGNVTHLGRVTATWEREGSLIDGTLTATYVFTAANGDSLFVESVGQADLLMAPDIHVLETATITGGTGRFTGATGTLSIERIVVITGPDTDMTSQWIDGYIVMDHGE